MAIVSDWHLLLVQCALVMADDDGGSRTNDPAQPVASTSQLPASSDPVRGDIGASSSSTGNTANTQPQPQQTVYRAPFFASAAQPEISKCGQ